MNSQLCNTIFDRTIDDYHKYDSVDHPLSNPHPAESIEAMLYHKNWIDTVQWHLEDLIRSPELTGPEVIAYKRRIDKSNQDRTDMVERIDDWFLEFFRDARPGKDARINSETPAWLVDRMSILALKIYHMREQTLRKDVDAAHLETCQRKLDVLLIQRADLARALDELIQDIQSGIRFMKVYRQMKMYNDEKLNPVLYAKKAGMK